MKITIQIYESGRTVLSKPVRDALGVGTDDLVEIRVDGYTTTVPIRSTSRVTIPSAIRDEVGIEEGDLLQIDVGLPS